MPAYTIALEMTILLSFWLCLGVLQRDGSTPGRTTFAALTMSVALWCLGEILQHGDTVPDVWADRVRFLGGLTLPVFWLGLAAHATRSELARRVPWFPIVALAPLAVPYALMFSETWAPLFLKSVEGGVDQYGPLFWVSTSYCYVLSATGYGMFVVDAWKSRKTDQWKPRAAVGLAAILPMVGNAVFVARGFSDTYDMTPLLFGAGLVALRAALFSGSLLQALPISQHDLIEQLPIGVILTDKSGAVIDLNPAAELRLGIEEVVAIGRNLDAVLSEADSDVQADVAPVFSRGREVGQLVLIDPLGKGD